MENAHGHVKRLHSELLDNDCLDRLFLKSVFNRMNSEVDDSAYINSELPADDLWIDLKASEWTPVDELPLRHEAELYLQYAVNGTDGRVLFCQDEARASYFHIMGVALYFDRSGQLHYGYRYPYPASADFLYMQRSFRNVDMSMVVHFAVRRSVLWPPDSDILVYFMEGNHTSASLCARVMGVAGEWSRHCSIRFVQTDSMAGSHIRVSFTKTGMHWSAFGTEAMAVHYADRRTMSFGIGGVDTDSGEFAATVLQVFGYALGLTHSHRSAAAAMKWKRNHVRQELTKQDWSHTMITDNYFDPAIDLRDAYAAPDMDSIMNYDIPGGFTEDGMIFRRNEGLSEMDKQWVGRLYTVGETSPGLSKGEEV